MGGGLWDSTANPPSTSSTSTGVPGVGPSNAASRMESHGTPGKIQVTHATHELLADEFEFETRR